MKAESLSNRDGVLTQNWYVACLGSELRQGKPLARQIYDRPLVLFRDAEASARCLPDRCLHRHAQLSQGVVLPDGKLACPYHGWVYDRDGRVTEVPSRGPKGAAPAHCHRPLPTHEQDGCVWVWLGDGTPPGPPPFRFPSVSRPSWTSYFMVTDFENEVGNLAENFMDVPHTVFVHKGWFRTRALRKVPIRVDTEGGSVLVTYEQPNDVIGFSGRVLNPTGAPMLHTDRFLLPNITRVDYTFGDVSGFIITSQITPVGTLKSRVYTEIVYKLAGPPLIGLVLRPFMRFYTRRVIQQDVEIMAIQAENLHREISPPRHDTEADVIHSEIDTLRQLAAQGSPEAWRRNGKQENSLWI